MTPYIFIMCQKSHKMINCIDGLIGFGLPKQINKSFQNLCELLVELGFAISDKKLVPSSTCVTYLGVDIRGPGHYFCPPPR